MINHIRTALVNKTRKFDVNVIGDFTPVAVPDWLQPLHNVLTLNDARVSLLMAVCHSGSGRYYVRFPDPRITYPVWSDNSAFPTLIDQELGTVLTNIKSVVTTPVLVNIFHFGGSYQNFGRDFSKLWFSGPGVADAVAGIVLAAAYTLDSLQV